MHFPTIDRAVPISFAHCKPTKHWIRSLLPSGAYLGLAPGLSLSQTHTKSILTQLDEKGLIEAPIFSLVVVDGQHGVFNIGGTTPKSPEKGIGMHQEIKKRKGEDDWKWMKRLDTEGWWTIPLTKLWVNGVKILEKQTVLLDVRRLPHCLLIFCTSSHNFNTDQYPIPHSTTTSCPSILPHNLRLKTPLPTLRPIPHLPLLQPTTNPTGLRRLERQCLERKPRLGHFQPRGQIQLRPNGRR